MTWLQGKKTYILMACAIIYAITGYFTGNVDPATALKVIWAAATAGALRSGINSAVASQQS